MENRAENVIQKNTQGKWIKKLGVAQLSQRLVYLQTISWIERHPSYHDQNNISNNDDL